MKWMLAACLLLGCATTHWTELDSRPQGAKVELDGKAVGVTPVRVELENGFDDASKVVRLELAGHETLKESIIRNKWNNANLVGAIMCIFPALWLKEYKPYYLFELQPGGKSQSVRR